ncbi:hypothetical protein ArV1_080 [Arthrobacter phage vB_ArtM-ArV1]|uniref:Uncharacterized protein n=1 Tax=Arthrobacter phage vB_ArtM-ArV1 TaxID=1566993 RepID=A0A0A7HAR4_9CAUD|nr:hypothetical protein ArV1_080 [Arthrobacter phage vB_ArtM-ArV1]AIZ01767.1 hypothetical protein ArV1_080 [Arthrobacter phage vB_ArtM-ArV1]
MPALYRLGKPLRTGTATMSSPIREYLTYTNDEDTRALSINPHADGGVFLKLSSVKANGHNQLGSILVKHDDLPAIMFELTGGAPSEQDFADAKEIADAIRSGDNTQLNVTTTVRRLLLALHLNIHSVTVDAPPVPREGCPGCAATDEAVEAAAHAETLQDPDYDPTAKELDAHEVPDTEPNTVALLAAENANLRNKLAAIQALTNPAVAL